MTRPPLALRFKASLVIEATFLAVVWCALVFLPGREFPGVGSAGGRRASDAGAGR